MNRRAFLQTASIGAITTLAAAASAADISFPTKVDPTLFETINRAKNAAQRSGLEASHAPYLICPDAVKPGVPFTVEVSIGERLHPMGPSHWIEFIALSVGNEPAGRVDLQPRGFLSPKVAFQVVLPREVTSSGRVTLVAHQRCNLHGYWEGTKDVTVAD